MRKGFALLALTVLIGFFAGNGFCAETVHLYLKANGQDIKGESSKVSMGRADSIECLYFEHLVSTARDAASGMATGRRMYSPILIRKRIDKASPVLMKAFVGNQKIDGTFKFFRPNPMGDGTTQQFYTIEMRDGRIASVKQFVPDVFNPASVNLPPMEEVTFVFHTITWIFPPTGAAAADNWSAK